MSGILTLPMLGLILFCILAETAREVCFKQSANEHALLSAMARPITWLGIVFGLWSFCLDCGSGACSPHHRISPHGAELRCDRIRRRLYFKETINLRHATGVFLVTAGVACVGVTGL